MISEKTGLKFEVREGLSWPEAYDLALSKDVDVLPAIGKTPEREEHFHFSEPLKPLFFCKNECLKNFISYRILAGGKRTPRS